MIKKQESYQTSESQEEEQQQQQCYSYALSNARRRRQGGEVSSRRPCRSRSGTLRAMATMIN